MADARQRFLAKPSEERLERLGEDKRAGRYLELLRLKNDLVFRARDYVRWHAAAARSTTERHRLYQPIYDFLTTLRQLVEQLDAIEGAAATLSKPKQVDQALDGLDLLVQTLRPLSKAIEEDGLYKEAAELIELADKDPAKTGIAGPIDSLLATPLLPAALRMKLLRARSRLEQPFAAEDQLADVPPRLRFAAFVERPALRSGGARGATRRAGGADGAIPAASVHRYGHRADAVGAISRARQSPRAVLPATAENDQPELPSPRPGGRSAVRALASGGGCPRCSAGRQGRGRDSGAGRALSAPGSLSGVSPRGRQGAACRQDAQVEIVGAGLPPRWGGRAAKFPHAASTASGIVIESRLTRGGAVR